jgi:fatty acid desaturase
VNAALVIAEQVATDDAVRPRLLPADLAPLYQRSDLRSAAYVVAVCLALVGVIILAAAFPNWVVLLAAVVVIGALQHHLSIIHHEAVHCLLFRSRTVNEAVGSLVAFATGFSMAYRTHHLYHHRHLGSEGDPDLDAYAGYPTTPAKLLLDVLWHLCGGAAVQQFLLQLRRARALTPAAGGTSMGQMLGIAVTQVLLFTIFAAAGRPLLYFVLWLIPLLAVAKTLAHFRGVVEHTVATRGDGGSNRFRTILCGPIERFLFAPMNFNYHAEHHFYPAIPYHRLPQAHRILSQDPRYHDVVSVQPGYLAFLWREATRPG